MEEDQIRLEDQQHFEKNGSQDNQNILQISDISDISEDSILMQSIQIKCKV